MAPPAIPKGADDRILPALEGREVKVARTVRLVLIVLAMGAVLGSDPLRRWTEGLPDSDATPVVQTAAARWDSTMGELGARAPYERVRAAVRRLEALRL